MIKIKRKSPPENNVLDSKKEKALKELERLADRREPKSNHFETLWSDKNVKEFLCQSQHGKCCYCERKRDPSRESDVEHFRPKSKVEGSPRHQGYWWLAYEWENLLVACKTCNETYKKSHFPLEDETERAYKKNHSVCKERPLLINPLEENPVQFIEYDLSSPLMVRAVGKCKRGKKTIELTGINHPEVMEERAERLKYYKNLYLLYTLCVKFCVEKRDCCIKKITEVQSEDKTFSGFATFYFKKMGLVK